MDINCFVAFLFYIGEILFYPLFILILILIIHIFEALIMIPFILYFFIFLILLPYYCCCLCLIPAEDSCLKKHNNLMIRGAKSYCFLYGLFLFYPFIGIYFFFKIYYLIFVGKISPYFTFKKNWKEMTSFIKKYKEINREYYNC